MTDRLAEGRRLLAAMRAEEKSTSEHDPRPAYADWAAWARNTAEAMLVHIDAITLDIEHRKEDYDYVSRNYRELRRALNRILGVVSGAAQVALHTEVRGAYGDVADALRRALDGPFPHANDGLPPPPLPAGLDPTLGDWKIAAIDRGGEAIILHANPIRFDEVRVDGKVVEWTITLTPPTNAGSDD